MCISVKVTSEPFTIFSRLLAFSKAGGPDGPFPALPPTYASLQAAATIDEIFILGLKQPES